MPNIETEFLFHIELEVGGFHFIGNTPYGNRRVAFVDGGTFEGPKLKGTVHGGSDWLLVRGDGSTELDVRLVLETDDNEKMCLGYPACVSANRTSSSGTLPGIPSMPRNTTSARR